MEIYKIPLCCGLVFDSQVYVDMKHTMKLTFLAFVFYLVFFRRNYEEKEAFLENIRYREG